jgi:hypothetical protein
MDSEKETEGKNAARILEMDRSVGFTMLAEAGRKASGMECIAAGSLRQEAVGERRMIRNLQQ